MPIILATWEVEIWGIMVQGQSGQIVSKATSQPIKAECSGTYLSSQLLGKLQKKAHGPGQHGHKERPYLKIIKAKRAGGIPQAVEHLSRKHKFLKSIPLPHTHANTHTQS
jgi:hypothetical protein